MDSLQVVVVASPFSNLTSVYEVDPDADVLLIVPPSTSAIAPLNKPHVNGFKAPANGASPASRLGLRIKVSSKHLALATPVFKTKLQAGNSRTTKQSDGRTHLQLAEGFDPTAVTIVMNAIHGRGSKIPKSVDIKTLAQIALLVDRFQLFDVLEVYAERWIWKLEDTIPHAYGEDLVRWVYASHIFRHATVFKTVTEIAATQSSGPIDTFGLPIREKIISKTASPSPSPPPSQRLIFRQKTSTRPVKPSSPPHSHSFTKPSTTLPHPPPPQHNPSTPYFSAHSSNLFTNTISFGRVLPIPSSTSVLPRLLKPSIVRLRWRRNMVVTFRREVSVG